MILGRSRKSLTVLATFVSLSYILWQWSLPSGPRGTVVVASTRKDDTSWVHSELPGWDTAVYVADDTSAPLHPEVNKGNEANIYLKYIIDNYDDLPEVVVFVHGHRETYHVDSAFSTNPETINLLKTSFIKRHGFHNLNCWSHPRCEFRKSSFWNGASDNMRELWDFAFAEPMPDVVACPKYAQFAVSREAIRKRPQLLYQRLRKWLLDSKEANAVTGRTFEHLWHFLFGKGPIFCMKRVDCLGAFDTSTWTRERYHNAIHAYDEFDNSEVGHIVNSLEDDTS